MRTMVISDAECSVSNKKYSNIKIQIWNTTKNIRVISYSKFQTTFSQSKWRPWKRNNNNIKMRNTTEPPNVQYDTTYEYHITNFISTFFQKTKKYDRIFNIQILRLYWLLYIQFRYASAIQHPVLMLDFSICRPCRG